MALTYRQAMLVKLSFHEARQRLPLRSTLFYDTLFAGEPELRRHFNGDLAKQQARLIRHLSQVIDMLAYPKIIEAQFEALAQRHIERGIDVHDFPAFNAAMIETVEMLLGDDFTSELEIAWRAALSDITRRMISQGRFPQ